SESKLVPLSFAKSSHCSQVADFITQAVSKNGKPPHALLEVGAALGRIYYELVQRLDSLKQATLVEPSGMLLNGLKQLLVEEQQVELTYIHGLNTFKTVEVDNR
ncbi:hypothetical protein OFN50_29275, partial [Escherichia coli]|nr:hypothetical protein [Escherichia coli]